MAKGSRLFWTIASAVLIWLFLAGFALLTLWPSIPSSRGGWLLLVVIGPPLYVAGEFLAERGWSSKFGQTISEHPSRTFRIVAGVIVGSVLLLAILIWFRLLSIK